MSKPSKRVDDDYPIPIGVALLAFLNIIVGIFAVYIGIRVGYIIVEGELTLVGSYQLGALFVGVFAIIAGVGLWQLRSWALWLAVVDNMIALLINLAIILVDNNQLNVYFLPILLRVVILVYLMHPRVKNRFR
jgi:hypothetical protein